MPPVITRIFGEKVVVQFNPGRHTYMISVPMAGVTKIFTPSVTGILGQKAKGALTAWAARKSLTYVETRLPGITKENAVPEVALRSLLAEAADGWAEETEANIGSLAHRFFNAELLHRAGQCEAPKRPVLDPVMAPEFNAEGIDMANASIDAGLEFFSQHDVKPIMLERVLFSPTEGYVGTTDFIGYVDGQLAVLDFKTSKRVYSENFVQLAAYANAYQEEFNVLPLERYIVNTKKTGGLEVERRGVDTYGEDIGMFRACTTLYAWDRQNDPWKKGSPTQVLGNIDTLIALKTKTS